MVVVVTRIQSTRGKGRKGFLMLETLENCEMRLTLFGGLGSV